MCYTPMTAADHQRETDATLAAFVAANKTFTAWDVTSAIRKANQGYTVDHGVVRTMVRDWFRAQQNASGAYESNLDYRGGQQVVVYSPVAAEDEDDEDEDDDSVSAGSYSTASSPWVTTPAPAQVPGYVPAPATSPLGDGEDEATDDGATTVQVTVQVNVSVCPDGAKLIRNDAGLTETLEINGVKVSLQAL